MVDQTRLFDRDERHYTLSAYKGTVDCKLWRPRRAGSVSYTCSENIIFYIFKIVIFKMLALATANATIAKLFYNFTPSSVLFVSSSIFRFWLLLLRFCPDSLAQARSRSIRSLFFSFFIPGRIHACSLTHSLFLSLPLALSHYLSFSFIRTLVLRAHTHTR